jgi:hypothetical protein
MTFVLHQAEALSRSTSEPRADSGPDARSSRSNRPAHQESTVEISSSQPRADRCTSAPRCFREGGFPCISGGFLARPLWWGFWPTERRSPAIRYNTPLPKCPGVLRAGRWTEIAGRPALRFRGRESGRPAGAGTAGFEGCPASNARVAEKT